MKKAAVIAAAGALTVAAAVPALAIENEFHGMYKAMFYQTNFFNGEKAGLAEETNSGFFAEQRARLQYIAKASDDLKLVTQFEMDARFGGKEGTYLGAGNDAGNLDADQLTLETKNVYLDFNDPFTKANFKVGIQPWADSYKSAFLLADMAGVTATKKIGPATAQLGWFRIDDDTDDVGFVGRETADIIIADLKHAVNKDITLGLSYYNIQNDNVGDVKLGTSVISDSYASVNTLELLHMVGINAAITAGPAKVEPFFAYQFGDDAFGGDISAFLAGTTAKVKAGPGSVNLAALYLSGDDEDGENAFRIVANNTSYFNPANMWLLIRSGQAVNSSTSILGNDITNGGLGLLGLFAGYEGTQGKVFYNANVGYAQTAKGDDKGIGTELNAQVGYKLYDNLSVSLAGAYAILGDRYDDSDPEDPYMANLQVSYVF